MRQILLFFALLLPVCLSAQLIESFEGSELSSVNPWKGSVEKFKINDAKELQLFANYTRSEACIYIGSSCLLDNEWRFKVRIDQKATNQNYVKVFLWCEQPDMKYPGEALFVRLGYTDNNVALCYQLNNLDPEILISGRPLLENAAEVEIKVRIDAEGNCTLDSKSTTDNAFYEEGKASTHLKGGGGYFMLGAYYTDNYSRNKYFDDIYIHQYIPNANDPEDPSSTFELIKLEQESATSLLLYFNKEIYLDEEACFILSGIGEIDKDNIYIGEDEDDPDIHCKLLKLVWDQPLNKGEEYELTYFGVYDGEMNESIEHRTFLATYGEELNKPEEPAPSTKASYGDVIINEIMANPKGLTDLPQTEYIELYNTTDVIQPLAGWSLLYGGKATPLGNLSLPENGYMVVYRAGRNIDIKGGGLGMPLDKFPAQLANAGKDLQLMDPSGQVIDEVTYEKATAAKSWERSDEEWYVCSASEGGTPGIENSLSGSNPEEPGGPDVAIVQPGEIVFNELLPNPYPEGCEYIELYNRSGRELLLNNLSISIRKSDGSLSTKYPLFSIGKPIVSKGYVLLTKDKEGVLPLYLISSPDNLYDLKLPILANTSSTLVLYRSSDEVVIDEVCYSSKWHAASVKEEKGVALERLDPDKNTQDEGNWTSASETAGYGTPGYRNSQDGSSDPGDGMGIEAPAYSELTGLYSILYYLDQPGYNCRAGVYDLSGRQVAQIANHALLGASGELTWDGLSSGGATLKRGLYIFHVSLYHTTGKTKEYKKVFLIR